MKTKGLPYQPPLPRPCSKLGARRNWFAYSLFNTSVNAFNTSVNACLCSAVTEAFSGHGVQWMQEVVRVIRF